MTETSEIRYTPRDLDKVVLAVQEATRMFCEDSSSGSIWNPDQARAHLQVLRNYKESEWAEIVAISLERKLEQEEGIPEEVVRYVNHEYGKLKEQSDRKRSNGHREKTEQLIKMLHPYVNGENYAALMIKILDRELKESPHTQDLSKNLVYGNPEEGFQEFMDSSASARWLLQKELSDYGIKRNVNK